MEQTASLLDDPPLLLDINSVPTDQSEGGTEFYQDAKTLIHAFEVGVRSVKSNLSVFLPALNDTLHAELSTRINRLFATSCKHGSDDQSLATLNNLQKSLLNEFCTLSTAHYWYTRVSEMSATANITCTPHPQYIKTLDNLKQVVHDLSTLFVKTSSLSAAVNTTHPRPGTCLTQRLVLKHVVSYKSCMKPGRTRIWGWSNLLWEVFQRYSQKCQSTCKFEAKISPKYVNFRRVTHVLNARIKI